MSTLKTKNLTRLTKLEQFERHLYKEQMGQSDFEYRKEVESLRLRVLAEIKLERLNTNA